MQYRSEFLITEASRPSLGSLRRFQLNVFEVFFTPNLASYSKTRPDSHGRGVVNSGLFRTAECSLRKLSAFLRRSCSRLYLFFSFRSSFQCSLTTTSHRAPNDPRRAPVFAKTNAACFKRVDEPAADVKKRMNEKHNRVHVFRLIPPTQTEFDLRYYFWCQNES